MLFLQVKCSNLLFRLLISKATAAGLENQLEVNFARARRSSLHLHLVYVLSPSECSDL